MRRSKICALQHSAPFVYLTKPVQPRSDLNKLTVENGFYESTPTRPSFFHSGIFSSRTGVGLARRNATALHSDDNLIFMAAPGVSLAANEIPAPWRCSCFHRNWSHELHATFPDGGYHEQFFR